MFTWEPVEKLADISASLRAAIGWVVLRNSRTNLMVAARWDLQNGQWLDYAGRDCSISPDQFMVVSFQ